MKLWFLSLAAAVFTGHAYAIQPALALPSTCDLKFSVHIESFIVFSRGTGTGTVTCRDSGVQPNAEQAVDIQVEGIGLGMGLFDIDGEAKNIGILGPNEISGTYLVIDSNVAVGTAVGASLGFEGQNGLSFLGTIGTGHGVGLEVNGQSWTITPSK